MIYPREKGIFILFMNIIDEILESRDLYVENLHLIIGRIDLSKSFQKFIKENDDQLKLISQYDGGYTLDCDLIYHIIDNFPCHYIGELVDAHSGQTMIFLTDDIEQLSKISIEWLSKIRRKSNENVICKV